MVMLGSASDAAWRLLMNSRTQMLEMTASCEEQSAPGIPLGEYGLRLQVRYHLFDRLLVQE